MTKKQLTIIYSEVCQFIESYENTIKTKPKRLHLYDITQSIKSLIEYIKRVENNQITE